jgi:CBS domain-containing protein
MATIEKHVTRDLIALDGGTPCNLAARLMVEQGIGSIAVQEDGRVVGLVTERDLVARVLADGAPVDLPIREAMRSDLPTVSLIEEDGLCSALMRDHCTRYLLVSEGDEVAGIISMRDLIRLMLSEKEWLIEQLQTFIDGHDGPHEKLAS